MQWVIYTSERTSYSWTVDCDIVSCQQSAETLVNLEVAEHPWLDWSIATSPTQHLRAEGRDRNGKLAFKAGAYPWDGTSVDLLPTPAAGEPLHTWIKEYDMRAGAD